MNDGFDLVSWGRVRGIQFIGKQCRLKRITLDLDCIQKLDREGDRIRGGCSVFTEIFRAFPVGPAIVVALYDEVDFLIRILSGVG